MIRDELKFSSKKCRLHRMHQIVANYSLSNFEYLSVNSLQLMSKMAAYELLLKDTFLLLASVVNLTGFILLRNNIILDNWLRY